MEEQQKKRRRFPGWAKIVIAVVLTLVLTLGAVAGAAVVVFGKDGITLMQGYLLAKFSFVETDADLSKAVDSALDGMVEGLGDRWSYYLDPESYQNTLQSRANNYVGIGVTVSYDREDGLLVQEVTEEGPAQQAGVKAGDVITHVDGTSVAGDARYEATDMIAGEEGTQVELTLLGEDGTTRTVTCTRQTLKSDSVSSKLLDNGVGYVRLDNFYSGAASSLSREVQSLMDQGATSLVLDVRSNPGGYVAELIAESVEDVCGDDGYAHMGKLGNLLLKKQPDFDPRNYGFSKLSKLIRALGRFDWKTEGTDNSEYFVRDNQRDKE